MKISKIIKILEKIMKEDGDMDIDNNFLKEIEYINKVKQCTFADDLSKISSRKEKERERERILQFHLDRTKKAIEYSTTSAAKNDKKSIAGYLGIKNTAVFADDSNSTIEMIIPKEKFDKENYDYKKHIFGEDINYVKQLCDRITDLIINLGVTEFYVKPVKVMVKKEIRYETLFRGTKYEKINDHMEYGIVVKLSWE